MRGRLRLEGDAEWVPISAEVMSDGSLRAASDQSEIARWKASDIAVSRVGDTFEIVAEGETLYLEVEDPAALSGSLGLGGSLRDRLGSVSPSTQPDPVQPDVIPAASPTRPPGEVQATQAVQATSGWYADPEDPAQWRFWNGNEWTPARRSTNPTDKVAKPFYRRWWFVFGAVIVVLAVVSAAVGDTPTPGVSETTIAASEGTSVEASVPERTTTTTVRTTTSTTTTTSLDSQFTRSEENAIRSAESYLSFSAFSRSGLIGQLEFEGFTNAEATLAVDIHDVDWNQQAALSAQEYLDFSAFSESGLIDQLEFEGFTSDQATYGVNSITVDWNEQAWKSAESYLEFSSFSRSGLIDQLVFEGFTRSQATYGVDKAGL